MARTGLTRLIVSIVCLAVILALMTYGSPRAVAQWTPQTQGEACPSWLPSDRIELTCRCDSIVGEGSVWGTDIYTSDSRLCQAALHAGVVRQDGGMIQVHRRPGRSSYRGTTRNGITTSNYGSYSGSIVFEDPKALARTLGGAPVCPARYDAAPTGWSGDCRCEAVSSGSIWGANPYTSDSAVCVAARHAGVIGADGGLIHVSGAPGLDHYPGTTQNGLSSSEFGPWSTSFTVQSIKPGDLE